MIEIKSGKQSFFPTTKINPLVQSLFSILFMIVIITLIYYTFMAINPLKICNDGSLRGECSSIKPFYCENGKLIERASICGCGNVSYGNDESCETEYQNESKNITLKYILRGKEGEINYTIYRGLFPYLENIPKSITYTNNDIPLREDFKLKKINEPEQRALILPLVVKIQEITSDKQDQFRIAVSIVQKIEFGFSNKLDFAFSQKIPHQRYPYEVLYEQKGICGEKSELLVLLLKELGYETVMFFHEKENHESVGIKCPVNYSLKNTGYCFIETTGSSIITNNQINYIGGIKLMSVPEIMYLSKGYALEENMYEYKDAQTLIKIDKKIEDIGRLNPLDLYKLNKLKEKYQLAESYDLR